MNSADYFINMNVIKGVCILLHVYSWLASLDVAGLSILGTAINNKHQLLKLVYDYLC